MEHIAEEMIHRDGDNIFSLIEIYFLIIKINPMLSLYLVVENVSQFISVSVSHAVSLKFSNIVQENLRERVLLHLFNI